MPVNMTQSVFLLFKLIFFHFINRTTVIVYWILNAAKTWVTYNLILSLNTSHVDADREPKLLLLTCCSCVDTLFSTYPSVLPRDCKWKWASSWIWYNTIQYNVHIKQKNGGKKVISVTLTEVWFLGTDGLVWVFLKLQISWEFTHNSKVSKVNFSAAPADLH